RKGLRGTSLGGLPRREEPVPSDSGSGVQRTGRTHSVRPSEGADNGGTVVWVASPNRTRRSARHEDSGSRTWRIEINRRQIPRGLRQSISGQPLGFVGLPIPRIHEKFAAFLAT